MTLDDFKNLAAGIQSVMIAAAVFIGGAWAIFRFVSLRTIDQARVKLENARRALLERGTLTVTLHAAQITSTLGHFIKVRVTLKNIGNGTELLDWSTSQLSVKKLKSVANGIMHFSDPIQGRTSRPAEDVSIAAGEVTSFSYLAPVTEAGIYFVRYSVSCSPVEVELSYQERQKAGFKKAVNLLWGSDLIFLVEQVPTQTGG